MKGLVPYTINAGGTLIDLSEPQVMGILNVTPDSFYSSSRMFDEEAIACRTRQILDEGGTIIDVGAYSTRPGSDDVSEDEEARRLRMALATVRKIAPEAIVSIDTFRASIARMCVKEFGANIINDVSGGDADIADYSYLGPTPQTKIAAIVMIADASEAATRALSDRSPASVERVVRSIIEERMDLDQFAQCDITIRELTTIKQTLVEALSGVHHHRVQYPAIRFNRARQAVNEEEKN